VWNYSHPCLAVWGYHGGVPTAVQAQRPCPRCLWEPTHSHPLFDVDLETMGFCVLCFLTQENTKHTKTVVSKPTSEKGVATGWLPETAGHGRWASTAVEIPPWYPHTDKTWTWFLCVLCFLVSVDRYCRQEYLLCCLLIFSLFVLSCQY